MSYDRSLARSVSFWDGRHPEYDASIIMTTYMARDTLEEAIESIYAQRVASGRKVQLLMGVDPSSDGTFDLAQDLVRKAPSWINAHAFANELPNVNIGGRKTARTNFLNCYSRVRAPVVTYLNCDDAWLTESKLERQIDHVLTQNRACCTSLETEAPVLKRINDEPEVCNPFRHGTGVLFSSFAMPYFGFRNNRLWWTAPFLDLPILCYCWERFGIDRFTDEKTFYRISPKGTWSSQLPEDKQRLIRHAVIQMVLFGPYKIANKVDLVRWYRSQRPKKA